MSLISSNLEIKNLTTLNNLAIDIKKLIAEALEIDESSMLIKIKNKKQLIFRR